MLLAHLHLLRHQYQVQGQEPVAEEEFLALVEAHLPWYIQQPSGHVEVQVHLRIWQLRHISGTQHLRPEFGL